MHGQNLAVVGPAKKAPRPSFSAFLSTQGSLASFTLLALVNNTQLIMTVSALTKKPTLLRD